MKKPFYLIFVFTLILVLVSCDSNQIKRPSSKTTSAKTTSEKTESKNNQISDFNGYKYTIKDNKATIIDYIGNAQNIIIPSKINDYKVQTVEGINDNDNITYVKVSEGIKYFKTAFMNCKNLKEIILPDSLKEMSNTSITNCCSLTKINIPKRFESFSIDSGEDYEAYITPFNECKNLSEITVSSENKAYSSFDGILCSVDNVVIKCPEGKKGKIVLPDSIKAVVYYDDVISSAFQNCKQITSVAFPKNYGTSDDCDGKDFVGDLFPNCTRLKEIIFNEFNLCFSSLDGVWYNKDKTEIIRVPQAKTGVFKMPDSVKYIQDNSFDGCDNLKGVVISKNFKGNKDRIKAHCKIIEE